MPSPVKRIAHVNSLTNCFPSLNCLNNVVIHHFLRSKIEVAHTKHLFFSMYGRKVKFDYLLLYIISIISSQEGLFCFANTQKKGMDDI